MADIKQAYVSPPTGLLEITVIRDAQPRVLVNLDLGIPNFTVFSMKIPLVEDQPRAMSGLIAESVHVLLDEVASFMMSVEYDDEVTVQMYATVLAAFKGMSSEADSSKEQDKVGADPFVKTFEGTFNLPMAFVNETQKRVVTAAANTFKELERLQEKHRKLFYDKERTRLETQYTLSATSKSDAEALVDYELPRIEALMEALMPYMENEPLFEDEEKDTRYERDRYDFAKKNLDAARQAVNKGMKYLAPMFLGQVLGTVGTVIDHLARLHSPDKVKQEMLTAATKVQRTPKVRHIELTYSPKDKTTVDDAARVIRQYRNRSLKQQPKPLYVIVYDQQGRPTGTLAIGPKFKNQLLSLTQKRAAVDFSSPVSFPNEQAMKAAPIQGIPKAISVGGMTYKPEGVAGVDMALYHGPQDWLVKFSDGRSAIFPGRPTFRNMRRLNFPVPRNRFKWTMLPPEETQNPDKSSIEPEETIDATSGGTV